MRCLPLVLSIVCAAPAMAQVPSEAQLRTELAAEMAAKDCAGQLETMSSLMRMPERHVIDNGLADIAVSLAEPCLLAEHVHQNLRMKLVRHFMRQGDEERGRVWALRVYDQASHMPATELVMSAYLMHSTLELAGLAAEQDDLLVRELRLLADPPWNTGLTSGTFLDSRAGNYFGQAIANICIESGLPRCRDEMLRQWPDTTRAPHHNPLALHPGEPDFVDTFVREVEARLPVNHRVSMFSQALYIPPHQLGGADRSGIFERIWMEIEQYDGYDYYSGWRTTLNAALLWEQCDFAERLVGEHDRVVRSLATAREQRVAMMEIIDRVDERGEHGTADAFATCWPEARDWAVPEIWESPEEAALTGAWRSSGPVRYSVRNPEPIATLMTRNDAESMIFEAMEPSEGPLDDPALRAIEIYRGWGESRRVFAGDREDARWALERAWSYLDQVKDNSRAIALGHLIVLALPDER